MNEKLLLRSFYPVGHGVFCEESFFELINNNWINFFNIVYDCGSNETDFIKHTNYCDKYIINRTTMHSNSTPVLKRNGNIDVLFLSHYHEDHINGVDKLLSTCNVNYIISPHLDSNSRIVVLLSLLFDYFEKGRVDLPKVYIELLNSKFTNSDSPVIIPFWGTDLSDNTIFNYEDIEKRPVSFDNLSSVSSLKNGDMLNLSFTDDSHPFWSISPFSANNLSLCEKIVEEIRLQFPELIYMSNNEPSFNFDYYRDHFLTINSELFSLVKSHDLHNHMLTVHSGSQYNKNISYKINFNNFSNPIFSPVNLASVSALYCSDFLSGNNSFKKSLVSFYNNMDENILKNLHLIQVPHHGSLNDHDINLIKHSSMAVVSGALDGEFVSANIPTPNPKVMRDIEENDIPLIFVNELKSSYYYEIISII